jgi:hypothetical protein
MHRYIDQRFSVLFLCALLAALGTSVVAGVNSSPTTRYVFVGAKALPDIPLSYDPKDIHFQRPSIPMVAADLGEGNSYSRYGSNGKLYAGSLNLNTIPFWVYAQYLDAKPSTKCQYVLMDGLTPRSYEPIPKSGNVMVVENEANAAVLRNCGAGFEVVSRESYGSIFDAPFRSAYLAAGNNQVIGDEIPMGLARDYVNRLLGAFGGRVALQKRLDEAGKQNSGTQTFDDIPKLLRAELVRAGIRASRK